MATLDKSTTHNVKTAIEKDGAQVVTALTIHWDDDAATREFARRGVVIAWQNMIRATGDVPTDGEVKVSELSKRERGGFAMKPTAANANRMMAKLSNDEYAAALATMGVSQRDITRLVATRVNAAPAAPKK